jgi:hypothetical protein
VQQAAIVLLARLPESSICRGAIEWLRPLLVINRGTNQGNKIINIDVNSVPIQKGLKRIEFESHQAKPLGEFGTALVAIVSAVPLAAWSVEFGVEPIELIEASAKSDWAKAIALGLAMAVVRAEDRAIATAMIRQVPDDLERSMALFELLTVEDRLVYLQWVVDRDRALFWQVITRCPYRWDGATTEWILGQVGSALRKSKTDWTIVHWLADGMMNSVAEETIDGVLLVLESIGSSEQVANNGYVRQGIETLCEGLRFRQEAMGALRGDYLDLA